MATARRRRAGSGRQQQQSAALLPTYWPNHVSGNAQGKSRLRNVLGLCKGNHLLRIKSLLLTVRDIFGIDYRFNL
jgi:hypothetical protein